MPIKAPEKVLECAFQCSKKQKSLFQKNEINLRRKIFKKCSRGNNFNLFPGL
jgi:hypothetical protein